MSPEIVQLISSLMFVHVLSCDFVMEFGTKSGEIIVEKTDIGS